MLLYRCLELLGFWLLNNLSAMSLINLKSIKIIVKFKNTILIRAFLLSIKSMSFLFFLTIICKYHRALIPTYNQNQAYITIYI